MRINPLYCPSYTGLHKINGAAVGGPVNESYATNASSGVRLNQDFHKTDRTGLTCYRANYGVSPISSSGLGWYQDFDHLDGKGGLNWKAKKPFSDFTDGMSKTVVLVENSCGQSWFAGALAATIAGNGTTVLSGGNWTAGSATTWAVNQPAVEIRGYLANASHPARVAGRGSARSCCASHPCDAGLRSFCRGADRLSGTTDHPGGEGPPMPREPAYADKRRLEAEAPSASE